MKDPLADAFEGKKAVDLITSEQLDKVAKTLGVGLDSAATFLQGIGYAMVNPNLATYKNITELPGLFTEEGRTKTSERLLTGIAEVANQPYFKPGQILTDYESLSPADRATADRMTLLTDPFVLASPFYGGLRKKAQKEVGETLLQEGMRTGVSSMQPGLALSGGVAGGRGTAENYKAMVAQNVATGQSNYDNILNLLNEGIYTQKEIMDILGVSRGTISSVIKKSGFKDLTFAQKSDKLVDFNKSFDDNLNFAIDTLRGQSGFKSGNKVGDKIKFDPQGQGIAGYKQIKENLVKRYVDEYQLSVKEYETYIKDILATYGKTDLPPEFFVNIGRGKIKSNQIPNYKEAIENVKNEMDKVKPVFKKKWDYAFHQRNYANSLPPEEAAAYLKKIRESSKRVEVGQRAKNLADDPMNLSTSEQKIFDQVNELWKTNASTFLKQDEAAKQAILNNTDLLTKAGWRTDSGGNLTHAFLDEAGEIVPKRLDAFKKSLLDNEFDPNKARGFFQNDHIKEVAKGEPGQAGLSLLSNLQVLPSTLNQLFKAPAQTLIRDFLKRNPVSDNKNIKTIRWN